MQSAAILAATALALGASLPQEAGKPRPTFLGKAPPELAIPEQGWFNAAQPLSLERLRGRVVWLEFSFST